MSGIIPKTCFAFLGAAGGAGVTGAVIETGYAALKTKPASGGHALRVCLMDLDFENGALASYLDIAAGVDTGVMSGDPARIDGALTSAFVTKHDSGLRLLAAPGRLGGNDGVNPNCVLALMDAATTLYDVLILDVPRLWQPWTQAALMASDRSVMLTEMTIPALHATRNRLAQIEAVTKPDRPMDIVINKHERRSFRATITTSDARQALGRDITGFVAVDPATPRNAMNCGQPAGGLQADSRYAKDMAALMKILMNPRDQAGLKAAG